MENARPVKAVTWVFAEFLAEQKARIRHRTYLKYQSVIGLYNSYLESYCAFWCAGSGPAAPRHFANSIHIGDDQASSPSCCSART
jgi:hypothetical protein